MGVGDSPSYFAGRGYYNEHERRMLATFEARGFTFQPRAQSVEESIHYLTEECGVEADQARWQCESHNVLIIERILGLPFATSMGDFLRYRADIAIFNSEVLRGCEQALQELKGQLDEANRANLLHNDPVPPNIILSASTGNTFTARLVDFELAQDLNTPSPEYVSNSVQELYAEREVPANARTGKHMRNLDQHLMAQDIDALGSIRRLAEENEKGRSEWDSSSVGLSFVGGIVLDLRDAIRFWREVT